MLTVCYSPILGYIDLQQESCKETKHLLNFIHLVPFYNRAEIAFYTRTLSTAVVLCPHKEHIQVCNLAVFGGPSPVALILAYGIGEAWTDSRLCASVLDGH